MFVLKGRTMKIANPLYDVVFKYMMEDNDVAKLLISTIIGQKIVKLDFRPQEHTINLERKSLTVHRLDFTALIKTDQGEKIIIIEVQKAKFSSDIIRFRRYLGEQYLNKENRDIPIISIYFLGYSLPNINIPVIKVQRDYINLATNEKIEEREDFIESLTHDSFIIQVRSLSSPYNSEIEKFLSIFDQSDKHENNHILEINDNEYPELYKKLLRRLQKAALESKVRKDMDIEDDIVEELENLDRVIEKQEQALSEKDSQLSEKDSQLSEKDSQLSEKDSQLSEQTKIIEELKQKLEGK